MHQRRTPFGSYCRWIHELPAKVGIISREIALQVLGAAAPASLDWLEDEGNEGQRSLPVIYAARTGLRIASIAYET